MKVLSIFAHPDDEVIFGWPLFQKPLITKHLICVSGNEKRLACLDKISNIGNFSWETLGLPDGNISNCSDELSKSLNKKINDFKPDLVFTHNPHGEYQHPDHVSIFSVLYNLDCTENLLITDMRASCLSKKHNIPSTSPDIPKDELRYYLKILCQIEIDIDFYHSCKEIYSLKQVWTWDREPIKKCRLVWAKNKSLHRKQTIDILTSILCESPCCGAEIGVFKGGTTIFLANLPHVEKIYAIDPWENNPAYSDFEHLSREIKKSNDQGEAVVAESWEELYHYVCKIFVQYPNIHILREKSHNAIHRITEDLDFLFIDGNHEYEEVKRDITLWSQRIKPGGLIMGHDYSWNAENGSKRGVCRAVDGFFAEHYMEFEKALNPARHSFINRDDDRIWWQRKK